MTLAVTTYIPLQLPYITRLAVTVVCSNGPTRNKEEVSNEKISDGGFIFIRYICVGR